MKLPTLITSACLLGFLALGSSCKKEDDKPSPAATTGGSAAPAPAGPADTTDHITVLAHHHRTKPSDPVRINFERFKVLTAAFDPQNLDGAKATIEIDLSSFRTGSEERDEHLKSPAYLDVARLATVSVAIDNVKQKAGPTYTADAMVVAHGVTKSYPVTFDVLSRDAKSVRIKGVHTFPRLDFGIGADPAKDSDEQVGTDVTIEMVLTIAKS
jgi:polyisoprenoid-binding protein YceI